LSIIIFRASELDGKQRAAVEAKAQAVLDARQQFPAATLADLYDPLAMPPALAKPMPNWTAPLTSATARKIRHRPPARRIPFRPLRKTHRAPAASTKSKRARSNSRM